MAKMAEEKKADGNKQYVAKNYKEALSFYTQAIELCPSCAAYYGNRSATYMMLGQFDKALDDARQSVIIDPQFVKGHLRQAKCLLSLGEVAAAVNSYSAALKIEPSNKAAKSELDQATRVRQFMEKAEQTYSQGDYRSVVFCMDRCIELSPECKKFKITKAECLCLLKRYQESQEIANDILRMDSINADAVYVRGLCLYYQDNVDKAFQHFQQVLRLAPDHTKARAIYKKAKLLIQKKEEGNNAFRAGRLQDAYTLYSEAMEIDPNNVFTRAKLFCNRATVCSRINKVDQAISDCSEAIKLDDAYLKAYMRRAKCYMDSEQYEDAVRDYEKIFKIDKTPANKQLLQEAKLELKKSKRKDYYKLLGVNKSATDDEIKKAYRKRALLHHPDRHSGATEEVKKQEEKKFKEIGEAYSVLSDSKKKARYDSGQDLDDLEGGGGGHGFHDIDPNLIFQSFFGGGGGGPGGGFGGFQQSPGGFHFQFG